MHLQRPVFPQLIVTFGFLSRTVLSFDSLSLPTYATKKKTKLYLSSFSGVYSREESEILGLDVSDNKRIRQASVDRSLSRNKVKVNNHRTLKTTIPSGQNQLPFVWKVAKVGLMNGNSSMGVQHPSSLSRNLLTQTASYLGYT